MEQNNKYTKDGDFILNTRYEDLPKRQLKCKRKDLDSIGRDCGNHRGDRSLVKKFLADNGGNEQATVINSKIKSSLTSSAFANFDVPMIMTIIPCPPWHTTICVARGTSRWTT